jgi:hypothetical protein
LEAVDHGFHAMIEHVEVRLIGEFEKICEKSHTISDRVMGHEDKKKKKKKGTLYDLADLWGDGVPN